MLAATATRDARVAVSGHAAKPWPLGAKSGQSFGYAPYLGTFAMVLSPLYIPVAVTVVHWIKER